MVAGRRHNWLQHAVRGRGAHRRKPSTGAGDETTLTGFPTRWRSLPPTGRATGNESVSRDGSEWWMGYRVRRRSRRHDTANCPWSRKSGSGTTAPYGDLLAYASDESGTWEVFVTSLTSGGKWQMSSGGGGRGRNRDGVATARSSSTSLSSATEHRANLDGGAVASTAMARLNACSNCASRLCSLRTE